MIGSPLASNLMDYFSELSRMGEKITSVGAMETLLVMAGGYALMMLFGALMVRVPAADWKPDGWVPKVTVATPVQVSVDVAWRTPQFWLLWVVLCMNVTAGIGILGQASPMMQDMFKVSPKVGAGFVGLLSLFNLSGRFFWSSISDFIGRKGAYCVYFILGCGLYAALPWAQGGGKMVLFVVMAGVIISMYGGGFATIPAYLKDMFGNYQVGAIHGRLITAWSLAAVLGPQLVDRISKAQKDAGVPAAESYNTTLQLMAVLLVVGLVANLLVRPVAQKYHLVTLAK
jgi:MFS family permease